MHDIENEVRSLVPNGKRYGNDYYCLNPFRNDKNIGSFCICVRGSKAGVWKDFSSGECGSNFKTFKRFITTGLVGIDDSCGFKKLKKQWDKEADFERKLSIEEQEEKRREYYKKLWENGYQSTKWCKYLVNRGVNAIHRNVRFSDGIKHAPSDTTIPAMICKIQNDLGKMIGVHRTYLQLKDGKVIKADVSPNKMMFGEAAGGYVEITAPRGSCSDKLAFCEGIETGMSIQKLFKCRVKCALSASNLVNMRNDTKACQILICGDNDIAGKDGVKKLAYKLSVMEVDYKIIYPSHGNDFNDELVAKNGRKL